MSKKNEGSKNRLGLNLFQANLKRHPSVKGLFDEDGNMKSPTDSKDEFLLFNTDNKSSNDTSNNNSKDENDDKDKIKEVEKEYENDKENEKEKDKDDQRQYKTMSVQINRVEEKMVDNKETFFVEMNEQERKERKEIIKKIIGSNKELTNYTGKPLDYGFNPSQKAFDKNITEAMSKGKEYSEIEDKFKNQLKKK